MIDPAKNLADRYLAIRRLRPYYEQADDHTDVLPADLATAELEAKIDLAKRIWARSRLEGNPPLQEDLYRAINLATLALYRRVISEDGSAPRS